MDVFKYSYVSPSSIRLRPTPWILKQCGLESSGQSLYSCNSNSKIIAFSSSYLTPHMEDTTAQTVMLG